MTRKQFTFYESFYRAIRRIRQKSARADIYDAICAYALEGKEPDWDKLSDAAIVALELVLPVLNTAKRRAVGGMRSPLDMDGHFPTLVTSHQQATNKPSTSHQQATNKPSTSHQQATNKPSTSHQQATNKPSTSHQQAIKKTSSGLPKGVCKEGEIEKEVEKEIEKDVETETEVDAPEVSVSAERNFSAFWEAYPRKAGREKARKVFLETNVELDTLLDALREQKASSQWCVSGGRYIPYPATWLKEKRWEDQLAPSSEIPKGASGKLGEEELAAIRRVLAEG